MSRFINFMRYLYALVTVLFCIGLINAQPIFGTIGVAIFAYLVFLIYKEDGRKDRELAGQGFHIEYVSPGQLRAGEDEMQIVYHTPQGHIYFYGKDSDGETRLTIPAGEEWTAKVPEWATDQRELVMDRIQQRWPKFILV